MTEKGKLARVWYRSARWGCRLMCALLFGFRTYGRANVPRQGGFILASTHQSFMDPVFCGIGLSRELHYLARDTLWKNPFFAKLIDSLNAIPVKRSQSDLRAMKSVIERLQAGCGVCLYPEG